jgi:hypothetical protein
MTRLPQFLKQKRGRLCVLFHIGVSLHLPLPVIKRSSACHFGVSMNF